MPDVQVWLSYLIQERFREEKHWTTTNSLVWPQPSLVLLERDHKNVIESRWNALNGWKIFVTKSLIKTSKNKTTTTGGCHKNINFPDLQIENSGATCEGSFLPSFYIFDYFHQIIKYCYILFTTLKSCGYDWLKMFGLGWIQCTSGPRWFWLPLSL